MSVHEERKRELAKTLGSVSVGSPLHNAATVELQIILMQELTEELRQLGVVFYPAFGELVSEIKKHRAEIARASDSSSRLTRVIMWATVAYVVLTAISVFSHC